MCEAAIEKRISAAQHLGAFRDLAAAPALAQALKDDNREARVAAAVALATCGTRDSIPALLDALEIPDPVTAQAAAMAIENLTGQAHRFDSFATAPQRRNAAARWRRWFAETPWETIERTLCASLKSQSEIYNLQSTLTPYRAAAALGHVGGDAGRAALRKFVALEATDNPYPVFERDNRTDHFTFPAASPLNPRPLQEAVRAIGRLRDTQAIPLLAEILKSNIEPRTANLFLAEAAIEALGDIGTAEAETVLIDVFAKLKEYFQYVGWYSDHPALYACHSSPLHARLIEALDHIGSTRAAALVPAMIRSVPTDPDRALFAFNDDYETLVGRVLRRNGRGNEVIETCLALLGDPQAKMSPEIRKAIETTHRAWAGKPDPENRAAQILSLACRDRSFEPRVRAAFDRFLARPEEAIQRELANPNWTPVRHWTLFFLARSLGNLGDARSVDALMAVLADGLNEARHGRPDPSTPEIHFLQLDYTPCWRAAAAWALGMIGDRKAVSALLHAVGNHDNATDTRHTAAMALKQIADPESLPELKRLAANYPEVSTRKALLYACETIEKSTARQLASRSETK